MAEVVEKGIKILEGIGGGIKVWDEDTLPEKLDEAKVGGVQNGKKYIYLLWKTLLNEWFNNENSEVYLVTPFLDERRLEDVCRMILLNKAEERLSRFFVREICNSPKTISNLKERVFEKIKLDGKFDGNEQRLVNIFGKITDPVPTFHAKFICCVTGNKADVLVTSANFQNSHFGFGNLETVHYITTTRDVFEKRYLQPLRSQTRND